MVKMFAAEVDFCSWFLLCNASSAAEPRMRWQDELIEIHFQLGNLKYIQRWDSAFPFPAKYFASGSSVAPPFMSIMREY